MIVDEDDMIVNEIDEIYAGGVLYVVAMVIGPCKVCIDIAKMSESKLSCNLN